MKTKKEIKQWLLKNCVDRDGNLDLSSLDFSNFDGDIYISNMKVKNDLIQMYQIVGGDLYQCNQKVKNDLYQTTPEEKTIIDKIDLDLLLEYLITFMDEQTASTASDDCYIIDVLKVIKKYDIKEYNRLYDNIVDMSICPKCGGEILTETEDIDESITYCKDCKEEY